MFNFESRSWKACVLPLSLITFPLLWTSPDQHQRTMTDEVKQMRPGMVITQESPAKINLPNSQTTTNT